MPSALTWLDVSAEQQRRVRDMIRLFEEPGTRDELGVGPVRDAFSELLFPGTSVIQTRAALLPVRTVALSGGATARVAGPGAASAR